MYYSVAKQVQKGLFKGCPTSAPRTRKRSRVVHMYGAYLACVTTSSSRFEWLSLARAFLEQDTRPGVVVPCPEYPRKYVHTVPRTCTCMHVGLYHAHGSFKLSLLRRQVQYAHVDHFGNNSWQSSLRLPSHASCVNVKACTSLGS